MWVTGALIGEIFARQLALPRVVGYSLVGTAAALLGVGATVPLQGHSRLVVDLALALLLFEVGGRLRGAWLRHNPGLLLLSVLESLGSAAAVFFALRWLFALDVPTALTCAVCSIPASAAIAGRVAWELGADGQVTQRMALLTALNTLIAIIAMTALKGWWLADQRAGVVPIFFQVARSFGGALVMGAILALIIRIVSAKMNLRDESAVLLLLGLLVLGQSLSRVAGFSTLLAPLVAGILLRNLSPRPWAWPRHFGSAGGVLILMMFVVVGSVWKTDDVVQAGGVALVVVVVRAVVKSGAVLLLAPVTHATVRQGLALGLTLVPLSASVLIMLSDLALVAPTLTGAVLPIMVSTVAVLELVGPLAVKFGLGVAGELPPKPVHSTARPVTKTQAPRDGGQS